MEKGFTMDQALAEAARCLLCHDAPCSVGCPASTEPDKFIRKLRLRNIKGAAAVVKENNVLGGVCAVVCPTCTLCRQGCVSSEIDKPIRIGEIQRWLVEWAWETGFNPLSCKGPNGKKVAVIGAGPAGLTCAAELAREGFLVEVFEKEAKPGGMLQYGIPNHRMSKEFVDREIADITGLGVKIHCNSVIEAHADIDRLLASGFDAVFVATGAWKSLSLDVPGSDSGDVVDAMTFLKGAKSTPDALAPRVAGKQVVIVGGGDTAMDSAVTALRLGARDAYVVYRRSFAQMPGDNEEKHEAVDEGVHFVVLAQPVQYVTDGGKVTGVEVVRNRLGEPDSSGRRAPVALEGTNHVLPADLVIEAIGLTPGETGRKLGVEVDGSGRVIVSGGGGQTSAEGVFSGGDAVRGASIVANAVHDGKLAAKAIIGHLQGRS